MLLSGFGNWNSIERKGEVITTEKQTQGKGQKPLRSTSQIWVTILSHNLKRTNIKSLGYGNRQR